MSRLFFAALVLGVVALAAATSPARDGQRVLVLLDTPATKETHSVFFSALESEYSHYQPPTCSLLFWVIISHARVKVGGNQREKKISTDFYSKTLFFFSSFHNVSYLTHLAT
jgi:hypothetical protein